MVSIEPCVCGLQPEQDVSLCGERVEYKHSLSCKCGGDEINNLARADNLAICIDNWNSHITRTPFKHSVQYLPRPDADVQVPLPAPGTYYDPDPLRRYVRDHGGFCSGGGGPS